VNDKKHFISCLACRALREILLPRWGVGEVGRRVSGKSHTALFSKVQVVEETRTCFLLAPRKISLYLVIDKIYFMKIVCGKDFGPHGWEQRIFKFSKLIFGRCSFRISSGAPVLRTGDFCCFLQPFYENVRIVPPLGHDQFPPNP
jgi:hypothetical protein